MSEINSRQEVENLISDLIVGLGTQEEQSEDFISEIKEKADTEGITGCLSEYTTEQLLEAVKRLTENYTNMGGSVLQNFMQELRNITPKTDYVSDDPFL